MKKNLNELINVQNWFRFGSQLLVITELLRLAGTSEDHLVNPLLKQGQLEQVAQRMSGHVLNISKNEDSTNSLGKLIHCSTSPKIKGYFFCLNRISWNSLCTHCLLSCYPDTTEKSLAPSLLSLLKCLSRRSPQAFSSPVYTVTALSASPCSSDATVP